MKEDTQLDTDEKYIEKIRVARALGQVGDRYDPFSEDPPMRFFNMAAYRTAENVHRALLIDGEDPDGQLRYAWTNDDRTTWKVTEIGESVKVSDAEVRVPDSEPEPEDPDEWAAEWLEIVLDEYRADLKMDETRPSINDRIEFIGSKTLRLEDVDGRRAEFEVELA